MPAAPSPPPNLPQGPGFGVAFLYYFVGTALMATLLASKTLGMGLDTGIPSQLGLVVGGVGGVAGGLINRSRTLTLPCSSRKTFLQALNQVLNAMGYSEDPDARTDDVLVYRRSTLSQLFSGKVYLLIDGKQAYLSSRSTQLQAIQRKLAEAGIR